MSIPSKCCSAGRMAGIIAGSLVATGIAVLAWALLTRRLDLQADPLTEADRRISELEESLQRLQHSFNHTGVR